MTEDETAMASSEDLPWSESSMPPHLPASARSIADFFTRALSSFQSSGSKLSVICTVPSSPPLHHSSPNNNGQPPAPRPPRTRPRTLIVLDSSFNPPTRAHLRMATSAIHDLTRKHGRQGTSAFRLLLLLAVNNADKGVKPAAFDKRMIMMWAFARDLQRSLQSEPGEGQENTNAEEETLSVDLGLTTLPYFHEKSAALAELDFYNGDASITDADSRTEQVFLVGFDTLIRIFNPKYYGAPESTGQIASAEPTPMQKALNPFFSRARLRVTMRTDDEWGGAEEQRAYLDDLLKAEGMLSKVGGNRDWAGRIEMVEGRQVGADAISSTYARAAARERDWGRLGAMVPPEVRWWIEREGLYTE